MPRLHDAAVVELERIVDAFECAHAENLEPAVEAFLPDRSHPQYAEIAGELIRIDLEFAWRRGDASSLEAYRHRFADALADPRQFATLAFEEYRMRCQAGEAATPSEYRDRYDIDTSDWPPPPTPQAASRASVAKIPGAGPVEGCSAPSGSESVRQGLPRSKFLADASLESPASSESPDGSCAIDVDSANRRFPEFLFLEELGRGSFGRVYLARQRALANRLVALKLTSGPSVESERLAQLQHANIVPVYSVHEALGLQALCMPFLGRFTLADILGRLRRHDALPQSGMELLSTVVAHNDSTLGGGKRFDGGAPATRDASSEQAPSIVPSIRDQFERSNYVDAVVWIVAQIASGLAHAHERGILHRDLKPANILWADDGRPMLLDFNLSDRQRGPAERAGAVGGTMAYMAPEHLEALETGMGIDARCDVYSLGVVLFELLTRRLPFAAPRAGTQPTPASLVGERRRGAPSVRGINRRVPRSIDGLVARCLAPDPSQRYQSAQELHADLLRHLANEPLAQASDRSPFERLGKWARRHPRLSSASGLGTIAAAILACVAMAWTVRERHFERVDAASAHDAFVRALPEIEGPLSVPGTAPDMIEDAVQTGRAHLDRFHVLEASDWTNRGPFALLSTARREVARAQIAETLYLLADAAQRQSLAAANDADRQSALQTAARYNSEAVRLAEEQPMAGLEVLRRQQDALAALRDASSRPLRDGGDSPPVPAGPLDASLASKQPGAGEASAAPSLDVKNVALSPDSNALTAIELMTQGRFSDALPHLLAWRDASPGNLSAWLQLGYASAGMGNWIEAEECFTFCTVQQPTFAFSYFLRGLVRYELKKYQGAVDDFTAVLRLGGRPAAALVNRALAYRGLGDNARALADLNAALDRPDTPTRAYFIRAQVRRDLGDLAGASDDLVRGRNAKPQDVESAIARGMAVLRSDPEGALADFRHALTIDPSSRQAMKNAVHVLADRLGREQEALELLDAMVAARPSDAEGRASRAVARARLGDVQGALHDAQAALSAPGKPQLVLQAACAYALCGRTDPKLLAPAYELLAKALGAEPTLARRAVEDPDLQPLRGGEAYQRLLDAARTLASAGAHATSSSAPDRMSENGFKNVPPTAPDANSAQK